MPSGSSRRASGGPARILWPGQPPHALIADADTTTLRTLGALLRRDGLQVTLASGGETASRLLSECSFDLILADTQLIVGKETALEQAARLAPGATRIALATYATLDSALLALRAGAYHYLMKPVDAEELSITTRSAMERRQLQRELAQHVAELEAAQAELTQVNVTLRQQVAEATAELQSKVDELESANQRLRDTQEQHQRFVQMVAHEMRGPLNPIINYAQIAKRPTLDAAKRDEFMDSIVENAQRLNRLVGDLQTATRLTSGQFTLRVEPRDVIQLVTDLVAEFRATLKERMFTFERPDEPIIAHVDGDRVQQAVRNLLDNAVKYSAPDGAIEARVWREPTNALISVGDYGAGIPEDQMRRIMEPFIRLEAHARDVSGSGLGLFITRGIAEAHGGELLIRNRKEARAQGAIFTLRLPIDSASPVA
ncbi:MAG TPA: ATP-binding protein [Ktedonobacterales bacterium]|nr:ATP-binding protein [Ktedonobacterales bacterium]